jgi:hypothetical protein
VRPEKGLRLVKEIVDADAFEEKFPPKREPKNHRTDSYQQYPNMVEGADFTVSQREQRENLIKTVKELKSKNLELVKDVSTLRAELKKETNGNGVVLLRWKTSTDKGVLEKEVGAEFVEKNLTELIANGVKPEDIVVWSKRKQPKVKVELE